MIILIKINKTEKMPPNKKGKETKDTKLFRKRLEKMLDGTCTHEFHRKKNWVQRLIIGIMKKFYEMRRKTRQIFKMTS